MAKPRIFYDFTLRIDRRIPPKYPSTIQRVLHPEFECIGPSQYHLSRVGRFVHEDQKNNAVKGEVIYQHLQDTGNLSKCLNLQDGLAICEKGYGLFLKVFPGQGAFLWASTAENTNGELVVPYLWGDEISMLIVWRTLNSKWYKEHPALFHF